MVDEQQLDKMTAAMRDHAETASQSKRCISERSKRCCLSNWFPRLRDNGLPVPETHIIPVDDGESGWSLLQLLEGKTPPCLDVLAMHIELAAARVGYPAFLRTGQGSGKHEWKNTCFLTDYRQIKAHIARLVNWSGMVDMLGLSHDVFVVREYLPVTAIAVLPLYDDMPLVPEVRAFVRDGDVQCYHPYWPAGAIADGLNETDKADELYKITAAFTHGSAAGVNDWHPIAKRVAEVFNGDGAWSVDLLLTDRGWYVTDMADAAFSWHWPSCKHAQNQV